MFTVYSDRNIFENIILNTELYPNWNIILAEHADIRLDISDADLNLASVPGTPLFAFIMANGGKSPNADKNFFDAIRANANNILNKPRAVFFLNIPDAEATRIQSDYGLIVQNINTIDDQVLRGSFYKELSKDEVYESRRNKGWKQLIKFRLPPSNSIVISDDYLFSNEERGQLVGKSNIIQILDALLPSSLNTDYHILIISKEPNKPIATIQTFLTNLKTEISALRAYPIIFEVVFCQTIHKRKLILNYINGTCDKGFAVFKVVDGKTVRSDNDFRCERLFNRLHTDEGDTDYKSTQTALSAIKQRWNTTRDLIVKSGEIIDRRILGDCNPDKSLKNRLINDV